MPTRVLSLLAVLGLAGAPALASVKVESKGMQGGWLYLSHTDPHATTALFLLRSKPLWMVSKAAKTVYRRLYPTDNRPTQ